MKPAPNRARKSRFEGSADIGADAGETQTAYEELEVEYRTLLAQDPDLALKLNNQPRRIHSGKAVPEGLKARGIFYCYALPAPFLREGVAQKDEDGKVIWNEESGQKRGVFWDLEAQQAIENEGEIARLIRSEPTTPRRVTVTQENINAGRKSIEADFTQSYFRAAQAPLGVKAVLKCWMEIG